MRSANEVEMKRVHYRGFLVVVSFIGLLASPACVYSQQKVYKWVDEEGVVHFSEQPPGESPKGQVETFTTDPAPRHVPPIRSTIRASAAARPDDEKQAAEPDPQLPAPVAEIDISEMSLADLDRRCEDAREEKLAPLREAEIENCIKTGTGDQAWCETFWADYGAGGRTASGVIYPQMFNDLPECEEAWEERNYRGLYPGGKP